MNEKFVYLAMSALIVSGTALAQSSAIANPMPTPILDSYTADLKACQCSIDHPDAHGVPERVRKSDEMREKAWASNKVSGATQPVATTQLPAAMSANEGSSRKLHGSRTGPGTSGAK
ncbi:MAG: hypothetical protein WA532_11375 [Candidatus Korobacteraceae bacterium]